ASFATAARERAGFLEEMTRPAFRSTRPLPLANSAPGPIQLWKSRLADALLSVIALTGASSAPSSPFTLMLGVGAVDVPGASRPRSARTNTGTVVAPRPIATYESPGSSPSARPPSAPGDSSPPVVADGVE